MTRYYFHIRTKDEAFLDIEGMEAPDDATAHEYALHLISKTMLYDVEERDWRGWRVDVVNSRQGPVMSVLYPCRKWVLHRTFGKRKHTPRQNPMVCIAGCALFFIAVAEQAVAGNTVSCVQSGGSMTCITSGHSQSIPSIMHIEVPDDAHERAGRTAREQKWISRCTPVLRQDKYGVGRYHYSAPGCEFGKSED